MRSHSEYLADHVRRVQRSLACVSSAVIRAQFDPSRGSRRDRADYAIFLGRNEPCVLSGPLTLTLSAAQTLTIEPVAGRPHRFVGDISAYNYSISLRSDAEVITFHLHPIGTATLTTAHLHIGPAATGSDAVVLPGRLHKAHIPTGVITLEQVIHMLITEFGVEPRREDWESVLADVADA